MGLKALVLLVFALCASFSAAETAIQANQAASSEAYLKTSLQAKQDWQNRLAQARMSVPVPATNNAVSPTPVPAAAPNLTERCDCNEQNTLNQDPNNFLYSQSGQRLIRLHPYCQCLATASSNLPLNTIQQQIYINQQLNNVSQVRSAGTPDTPPAGAVANHSTALPTFQVHY